MALFKETTIDPGYNIDALTVKGNLYFKHLGSQSTHFKALHTTQINPNVTTGVFQARNEIFSNATTIKFGSIASQTNVNINSAEYGTGNGLFLINKDLTKNVWNQYLNTKIYGSIHTNLQNAQGALSEYSSINVLATDNSGRAKITFTNKKDGVNISSFEIDSAKVYFNEKTIFKQDVEIYSSSTNANYIIGSKYSGTSRSNYVENFPSTTLIGNLIISKYNNDYISSTSTFPTEGLVVIHGKTNTRIALYNAAATAYWDIFYSTSASNSWQDEALRFRYNGSTKGWINPGDTGNFLSFTGQHRNKPVEGTKFYSDKIGLIVISVGNYIDIHNNIGSQINESLPTVKLSSQRNQKNVFGVVSDKEEEDSEDRSYTRGTLGTLFHKDIGEENTRLMINSVGEGAIWVCNINGNLENGDYITTCEIPGYGMKQDDEFLHNYTVAKITCDCKFDLDSPIYMCEEFEFEGQIYRKAFVGCTYHCG